MKNIQNNEYLSNCTLKNLNRPFLLKQAASHHIESFNYIYHTGLQQLCQYIEPVEITKLENDKTTSKLPFQQMKIWYQKLQIGKPTKTNDPYNKDKRLMPSECRLSKLTYTGPLFSQLMIQINGVSKNLHIYLGQIPIMVRSDQCHLNDLSPQELIQVNEELNQFGGYFIINGNQKIIRMLILQKRNYPIVFKRKGFVQKAPEMTLFAIQMRCTRQDFFSKTITLHYINDGNIVLRILYRKQQFLIPLIVILKSLQDVSDIQIYNMIFRNRKQNTKLRDKIQVLIKGYHYLGLKNKKECRQYIGKHFKILLNITFKSTNQEIGKIFLKENICVHLKNNKDKFRILCYMAQKLYAFVAGQIEADNLDSLINQQILLSGQLYMMFLKQKLQEFLNIIRIKIIKDSNEGKNIKDLQYLKVIMQNYCSIGKKIETFLATGNLKTSTGLDLMQQKGLVIIADRINNMRFLSHFRSIHRGQYFAEMKTTTVRKLLPQSWGFLCPVHTPDGSPCGLLNHISIKCKPIPYSPFNPQIHRNLQEVCLQYGMLSIKNVIVIPIDCIQVMMDGKIIGFIEQNKAQHFVQCLRQIKVMQKKQILIPATTQIVFIKKQFENKNLIYPIIYLSYASSRLVRKVKYLPLNKQEWISPLQQVFIRITNPPQEITNHSQLNMTDILSILPQLIPFINHNQSPRNMYQCQMAKQTMGSGMLNYDYRIDNKIYRIMNSQTPIVKAKCYEDYGLNYYNSGVNAIVAVISYTGYDMQDAMIINKAAWQRGLGAGSVYKTIQYQLVEEGKKIKYKLLKDCPKKIKQNLQLPTNIDIDGLCKLGTILKKGSVLLVLFNPQINQLKYFYNKQNQTCFLDKIIITSNSYNINDKIIVKLRFNRKGIIGDKFSSRHGQKGVLSFLYPTQDMPFNQNGIIPDIIINPHAFPSRMTIAMLIQSLVGKTCALYGSICEFQHWQVYENDNILDYWGKYLLKQGFQYSGNQTMYSGIFGNQLKCEIFNGIVYYQRLRHMVSDKSQARSTGPVDILTLQPLKGRKKGGGIRVGQMERDALISHGLSYCIHQRLFLSSDYSQGYICKGCGSMLSCFGEIQKLSANMAKQVIEQKIKCLCGWSQYSKVSIPFVLRYLTNQLAVMNIRLFFVLK